MRRNLCAFRWPRATASLLSITAALAMHGCSKPGSVFRLPDLSGKAAADAKDRDEAKKREEALAGTSGKPAEKAGASGKATIASDAKEAPRSAGPVAVDRSGLAAAPPRSSATSLEAVARGRAALEAPDIPVTATRPAATAEVARRPADRDGFASSSQIAGSSWAGGGTKQRVAPASRQQPAKDSAWYEGADQSARDSGNTTSRGDSVGVASLDAGDAPARKPAARDWGTRVATSGDEASARTENRREDRPSAVSAQARFQVERLMATSRMHLTQGELFSAQRTALLAERIAAREKVSFAADEEHPSDLVRLIDRELDLTGRRAVAGRSRSGEGERKSSITFEEAANQFAAWRPADEGKRAPLNVQPVSGSRDLDPVAAMDRKPFASKGPDVVPARSESVAKTPAAWSHSDLAGAEGSEPAWNTDRSPVALSSAISNADDFTPGIGAGPVVPALGEEGLASPKSLTVPTGTAQVETPLFMPSVNLPEVVSKPGTAEVTGDSLAVANGPLLPATAATGAFDNAWEEELTPAVDPASEGFGKSFWALTSGIIAAAAILFGFARRLRRAERGA